MDSSLFRYAWRHSRGQQLLLLAVILLSLPFYWISLEIPKQIANNAIQGNAFTHGNTTSVLFDWRLSLPDILGGGTIQFSEGFDFERLPYLVALSLWFLVLVLINGAFKYFINVRKGLLGEAMLRRMRHDLFVLLLRFRPEDVAAVKPAEVASMIKDEVDPIGGFIGDAFIQPVFLGTQAATALIFIFVQSVWMGLATAVIVAVQAVAIPILRREQLRLGRMRQIESRRLAGRIGEIVETAPMVHAYGASAYVDSDVRGRLMTLFVIRSKLFKRKFAVKFLNNLLSQVTPFIFYMVGGYFALLGEMDIGQLIAVIAAYRDLPPPIKELIDWDQQRQDVSIKYEQVISQFSPPKLLPPFEGATGPAFPDARAPIAFRSVSVNDGRGGRLLDRLSLTLERPGHVALLGEPGGARDLVCRLLGRQVTAFDGALTVGGIDIAAFTEPVLARHLTYCGPSADLTAGPLRDNLLLGARSRLGDGGDDDDVDYERLGIAADPAALNQRLREAIIAVGGLEDVRSLGLNARIDEESLAVAGDRFVAARHLLQERIVAAGLSPVIERFDETMYNRQATIGENLLFGLPVDTRLTGADLARNPYVQSILEAEGLIQPLTGFGRKIAEMAVETFHGLPPDHPVFERYSFVSPSQVEDLRAVLDGVEQTERFGPPPALRSRLIELALEYIEPRHRMGLISPEFTARMLRARESFRRHLPHGLRDAIAFYDYDAFLKEAPVLDNLLFGRIAGGRMDAHKKIAPLVASVLTELELDETVFCLGLWVDVGKGGRLLQHGQRIRFAIARALVCRPEILVLESMLSALPDAEAGAVLRGVRQAMAGRSLIATLSTPAQAEGFDAHYQFRDGRVVSTGEGAR